MSGTIVDKLEESRRRAARCAHIAETTADPQLKATWIGMVGEWLTLADLAEKNSSADLVHETPAQTP
jgi:hypothetical protein